jgi:hypothetical protein
MVMASGMAALRFTSIWVLAALRIEIRLLNQTRSVLEYLLRLSVYVRECDGDMEEIVSQFSKNGRSSEAVTQKPDIKQ